MALPMGALYDASTFSSLSNTFHDFLIFTMENGSPKVVFQPKTTNTIVKHAIAANSNPSTCYIIQEGSQYRLIVYSNVATLAIAYFDQSFRTHIQTENSLLLDGTINFSTATSNPTDNGTNIYTKALVTRKKTAVSTTHSYSYVTAYNGSFAHTMEYWTNITNATQYVNNLQPSYGLKLYQSTPVWLNSTFLATLKNSVSPPQTLSFPWPMFPTNTNMFSQSACDTFYNSVLTVINQDSDQSFIKLLDGALTDFEIITNLYQSYGEKSIIRGVNQIHKQFNKDGYSAVYTTKLRYITITKNSVAKTFCTLEILYDRPTTMAKIMTLY